MILSDVIIPQFLNIHLNTINVLQILGSLFFAILFLQSGLDKVFDWKGNLSWLKEHFSKSILKNIVPAMLLAITVLEIVSGATSLIGVFSILFNGSVSFALLGAVLSAASLLLLFFGQRMAKDYAGAGGLTPYFIIALITIYLAGVC
jgi:uncharacterized membrane protein YphA (DoxX/SURF4 family)